MSEQTKERLTECWPIRSYDEALTCVQGWEFWQEESEINIETKQGVLLGRWCLSEIDRLRAEVARLESVVQQKHEALMQHGRHEKTCRLLYGQGGSCTCGLADALREEEQG